MLAALALLVFPFMPSWIGFWLAIILQQVSRLLSAIFVLSSSSKTFSLSNYSKVLSESHWASFFHQASLGNNLNCQFLSNTTLKHKAQNFADDQVDLHAYDFTLQLELLYLMSSFLKKFMVYVLFLFLFFLFTLLFHGLYANQFEMSLVSPYFGLESSNKNSETCLSLYGNNSCFDFNRNLLQSTSMICFVQSMKELKQLRIGSNAFSVVWCVFSMLAPFMFPCLLGSTWLIKPLLCNSYIFTYAWKYPVLDLHMNTCKLFVWVQVCSFFYLRGKKLGKHFVLFCLSPRLQGDGVLGFNVGDG